MVKKRNKQIRKQTHGQSIVEFAIVLPVVLLIVFGIIELGFLLFSYSSVNSASREAARYGIAIGEVGSSQRYYDCDGIVEAGLRIGSFAGMGPEDISIAYDSGPETPLKYTDCADLASHNGDDSITFGDRIVIRVDHDYHPLVSYMGLNISPFWMTSTSSRTIFKAAEIIPGGGDAPGGGGPGGGGDGCFMLATQVDGGTGNLPTVSPTTSGTDCGNNEFESGTVVTLTGQPEVDWYVGSWSGATPINDTQATVTMTVDTLVGVTYVDTPVNCFSLAFSVTAGNGVDPVATFVSETCTGGTFAEGETVNLLADPDYGWVVSSWTNATANAGDNTLASLTMPAQDAYPVSVEYASVDCFGLDLQAGGDLAGGGAPVALTESAICAPGEFAEGEVITVQAYPNEGYLVDSWTGAAENPSNSNQATFTMPASVPTVTVIYAEKPVLDPPSNLTVPNNFAAGDFGWTDSGGGKCTQVKFDFADSVPPRGNWPRTPDYYNVYVTVQGGFTNVYTVTGTQWNGGATVPIGLNISFGVEGVFLSNPSDTSLYSEVTYKCLYQVLEFQGALVRE